MKKPIYTLYLLMQILLVDTACNNPSSNTSVDTGPGKSSQPGIKELPMNYSSDSTTLNSFIAYDSTSVSKRPVVLVLPEWWGLNDYTRSRAKQLAALGYLAIAVDIYGNGKTADNPDLAGKMAAPFYQNPLFAKARFDAALAQIKSNPLADTNQVAVIGYCFGGGLALNMARLGEHLNGVVSFHGSLLGVPANKDQLKTPILVCHGEADQFVSKADVTLFRKQMDSIQAPYTFRSYAGATHAFTNPAATATGKKFSMPIEYNAAADTASWNDMKDFFAKIFR